ncbi:ABC transporter permease [Aquibium sp. ELW1220]|jgi:lipoprotein-releasing system permease protein|uniref:ABC transporter permease n=1 Tax=Aquibium sp. ELW1220 TaxID=2976766 RepID=UPI0025B2069A|nr:ABC transporter permease [Aquibium sp. ELW1220]MDN2580085.1 ABC transporter permease [Aquibium sp. ELW1220]
MLYALKISTRYLTASKAQTFLLVFGVAVGVFIFIFMSALIGGLAEFILSRTAGDLSHVTIEAEARDPDLLLHDAKGIVMLVREKDSSREARLTSTDAFLPVIERLDGVTAVSQQITGGGVLRRGAQTAQVSVTGVEPSKVSAIIDLASYLVEGSVELGAGKILIGKRLAQDMNLRLGQSVRLLADTGIDQSLVVTGIYEIGSGGPDRRQAYVSLATARTLYAMPQGISKIEIKLTDLYAADATARRIEAITGLPATSWTENAAQLLDALEAQAQTGLMLKSFALITIVIGVASALLLSTYRRRPEIGIMRAMGAPRSFVVFVFVMQGAMIGLAGGLFGAGVGYAVLLAFPSRDAFQPGNLPIDIAQGAYGVAILLTVVSATLAAILPARAASRVDPVTAIGQ